MGVLHLFILSSFLMMPNNSTGENPNTHAIYVSVLEVERHAATKSGSIMIKVFANDLEDAIYNKTSERVKLLESSCLSKLALVESYFEDHLLLKINTKEIKYAIDSCEVNDISIWFTFNFRFNESWQTIRSKTALSWNQRSVPDHWRVVC